jgi:hypothetical protein
MSGEGMKAPINSMRRMFWSCPSAAMLPFAVLTAGGGHMQHAE